MAIKTFDLPTRIPVKRRGLRLVVVVLGLVLVVFGVARWLQATRVNRALAEIQKAGFPITLAELDEWYQDVPTHQNAAHQFKEAADPISPPQITLPEPGIALPDEDLDQIADALRLEEETLQTVHEAAALKQSRYPVDLSRGANALLPHLVKLKQLAVMLRLEAVFACTQTNTDRAARAVLSSFAVAHSLANEPVLISDLVRIACAAITVDSLQRVLSSQSLTDAQLRLLAERAAETEADGPPAFVRALGGGERCMAIDFFRMPPSRAIQMLNEGAAPSRSMAVTLSLFRWTGIADHDFAFLLETLRTHIDAAQQPFPQSIELTRKANDEFQRWMGSWSSRLCPFSRMLMPAIEKVFFKEARLTGQLRAAQVGLAVERFRLAHSGKLPDRLEELCPAFLAQVPSDPFTGEPLRFEKLDAGYKIVCPGAGLDEGGASTKDRRKVVGFTVGR